MPRTTMMTIALVYSLHDECREFQFQFHDHFHDHFRVRCRCSHIGKWTWMLNLILACRCFSRRLICCSSRFCRLNSAFCRLRSLMRRFAFVACSPLMRTNALRSRMICLSTPRISLVVLSILLRLRSTFLIPRSAAVEFSFSAISAEN